MPRRADIETILIVGAGPIVIGQACEFDYSGAQACKALRQEGYRVVLVNSNPATIMTDPDTADATYIEPITPELTARVIAREKPDALLATMGGQTALNTAFALAESGVLAERGVELIGASREAIARAENRDRFQAAMARIGLETPRGATVGSLEEARAALDDIGLPAIVRPPALAGTARTQSASGTPAPRGASPCYRATAVDPATSRLSTFFQRSYLSRSYLSYPSFRHPQRTPAVHRAWTVACGPDEAPSPSRSRRWACQRRSHSLNSHAMRKVRPR